MRLGVGAALVDGTLVPGDVEVADGQVASVGLNSANGKGIASPGFVDLQVNGFAGVDFFSADRDGYRRAGQALLECGVTAYQPTFITSPEDELVGALGEVPLNGAAPRILGAHLEGPFIAPERLGTHPAESRRDPDRALLERLLAAGPVSHVTLAPELPGAFELVDLLRERGVTVSCGHSNATAVEARKAFARGAKTVTHIFNAMRPFAAREPGLAGAALVSSDVVVQLILDGVHLADDTARLVWQAAGGRVALVTDAIAAAGIGDGSYTLAGVDFEVEDGVARSADQVLAGSTVCMIDAVRNLVTLGAPLDAALAAASTVPARIAARPELGTLAPGSAADIVVLDDSLEIVRVLVRGADAVE
ncbi:MAG: N-acetylglucosamine-6-phosphate deacetylase [Actinobacteria bacterium]|nr:MAG: N-acetylglucosamine-6-phosphate deacetylase [Actinomycetota bacterium]